jgi:hypothetical protein
MEMGNWYLVLVLARTEKAQKYKKPLAIGL